MEADLGLIIKAETKLRRSTMFRYLDLALPSSTSDVSYSTSQMAQHTSHSFDNDSQATDLENALRKMESNTMHRYSCPLWRKSLIVFVTSWITLAATFSSTSLFSAANEIASEFSSTVTVVNISTGGVLLTMGLSTFIWIPLEKVDMICVPSDGSLMDGANMTLDIRTKGIIQRMHRNPVGFDSGCSRGT
jgi:hypothetical protein